MLCNVFQTGRTPCPCQSRQGLDTYSNINFLSIFAFWRDYSIQAGTELLSTSQEVAFIWCCDKVVFSFVTSFNHWNNILRYIIHPCYKNEVQRYHGGKWLAELQSNLALYSIFFALFYSFHSSAISSPERTQSPAPERKQCPVNRLLSIFFGTCSLPFPTQFIKSHLWTIPYILHLLWSLNYLKHFNRRASGKNRTGA